MDLNWNCTPQSVKDYEIHQCDSLRTAFNLAMKHGQVRFKEYDVVYKDRQYFLYRVDSQGGEQHEDQSDRGHGSESIDWTKRGHALGSTYENRSEAV